MRFSAVFRAWSGALALAGVLAFQASAFQMSIARAADDDEVVLAEDRLPPGVLLYVTSPDVVAAYEQFQKTSASALINDPSLEKFRAQLLERYAEFQKEAEDKLKLPLADLFALFSGEISMAVVRPVGQPLGWVAFMDIGEHEETLDALLLKAEEAFDGEKIAKETETIAETEVVTCTVTTSDAEDAQPVTVAYFVKDGMFVFGSDAEVLESVLTRWDGEHEETFAANEIYQEIVAKCVTNEDSEPSLIWYVDPVGLVASGLSMAPQTQNFAGMIYMPTLGLTGLKAFGGVQELATEQFDHVSRMLIYIDGPPTGVVKVFELRPSEVTAPTWVPADAGQYFALDWNIKGAYESIEAIYDSFLGPGKFAMATANLTKQAGVDLKLKADVIDVLSGKVQGYYSASAAAPEDFTGVISVGVTDPAKGQKLVDTVFQLAGGAKSADFEGTKIYEPANDTGKGVAAVKGNAIMISSTGETLKLALAARPANPLAATPEYKSVAKVIPKEVCLFSYQNAAGQFADVYEKARSGEFDGLVEGKLDFSVLPPFEEIRKYFGPNGAYYIPDESGAIGVQFSPKRTK
ncbi:hypothetical protein [Planctomicrobium piriforme]|uniref:DUF3352 domain-containing protein n=1 Tax=Planctomicrobium piriforme TaxID=1576369 RepID=A0A1I3N9H5_9PLAN|nr:hypothetical protein [Planctomicrobium piriforme]SFJ05884.1 hypothetical protein SAMN05421753_11536 [Planctomicrobium piriforme]